MKKLSALLLASLFVAPLWAQNDTIPEANAEEISVIEEVEIDIPDVPEVPNIEEIEEIEEILLETPEQTEIKLGENEVFIIEENGDTTKLQLGSKGISMIENEDGVTINVIDMEEDKDEKSSKSDKEEKGKKQKKFKPHYGGFEMGINNYLTPDRSLKNQDFMTLNTSRSYNFNWNFLEYGFGLGTSYAGLVTGMGIEWSSYVFDANNSIQKEDDGSIVNRNTDDISGINKSKLSTTYLTAPLLLEVQIPAGKKRIHLSGGVIGGVKIGSKTKIKYNDGDGKQKNIKKDDFSLSPFRYGFHVRAGYRSLNLFATYYPTPLFGEISEPELYPFSIGLTLIPF